MSVSQKMFFGEYWQVFSKFEEKLKHQIITSCVR